MNTDEAGKRFRFGRNWLRFVESIDATAIADSTRTLASMLGASSLRDQTFLDIGSGSGLSSLAAHALGAQVTSFDYDAESVECTRLLRARHCPETPRWQVFRGSILDTGLPGQLAPHDIVYSWGVLHHTGNLQQALDNAIALVKPSGILFIALYNDQGWLSRYWLRIKQAWVFAPWLRPLIFAFHAPYMLGLVPVVQFLKGRPRPERGMRRITDMIDWLGGYPFEVVKPDAIVERLAARGFHLTKLRTCGSRHGCNEFVFRHYISRT